MPSTTTQPSKSLALAQRAAQVALDTRAQDVILLDLRSVSDMTDFFLIASGTSDTHARAIGEHILAELKKEGSPAHHVEGLEKGRWVLLDFVDFVVHIFHPTLRNFYQLERLWADAEQVPLESGSGTGA
jgi:iojap-like ribosome-associated protein